MQIEITEKEKTALSILLGLRQKFAREKKEQVAYSASELHKMFSETIDRINKGELDFIQTLIRVNKPETTKDEIWGVVDEAIERSKIKRYNWNAIFGRSLTEEILILKKSRLSVSETYKALTKDARVQKFIESKPREKKKILENLKISVHARYGENNTAIKVMKNEE